MRAFQEVNLFKHDARSVRRNHFAAVAVETRTQPLAFPHEPSSAWPCRASFAHVSGAAGKKTPPWRREIVTTQDCSSPAATRSFW